MGGYGSSRWGSHFKKTTVEECLRLRISSIKNYLFPGHLGTRSWGYGDEITDSINFRVEGQDDKPVAIRLIYSMTDLHNNEKTDLDYRVRFTTTELWWGSTRYWFVCPLTTNGIYCGRRVGVLYLPPRSQYFGCRHCYELTYRSCQEAHQFDNFYQQLTFQMQADYPGFKSKDIVALFLGKSTPNIEQRAYEKYLQYWDDYDPYESYLTRSQLLEEAGLTPSDLDLLENARLLLPDTKDGRYRPKLASWGRKLAYLLGEGWNPDEIRSWSKGRWSMPNPRQWPPEREQWR